MKQFLTIFTTIFVAEIGDKTQLATLLFATENKQGLLGVFLAAAAALVASIALTILAGGLVTRFVPPMALKITAGIGFILVGIWTLVSASS
jgi:putative Ca2+/H+ antiporter (TMEM165/GDT1 family)